MLYKHLVALFANSYNISRNTTHFSISVFTLFCFSTYLISRANNIIFLLNIQSSSSQADTYKITSLLTITNEARLLAKSATLSSYITILAAIKSQPSQVDKETVGFQDFCFSSIISAKVPLYQSLIRIITYPITLLHQAALLNYYSIIFRLLSG